jgi:hypothetical protein
MNIRCYFGIHDHEPFGTGIKLKDIIENAVITKTTEEFNMAAITDEVMDIVNYQALDDIIPNTFAADPKKYKIENTIVRDTICLRCGIISMVVKSCREIMENRAAIALTKIIMREERKEKAKAMIEKLSGMPKCI